MGPVPNNHLCGPMLISDIERREKEARQTERPTDHRPRDRKTERQRDRETERQRDRETERQRDRETERPPGFKYPGKGSHN
jgi:hypothetical protein